MKKLLLVLAMWLAMVGAAFAAVNINTATKEQLDGLKGIGPVKAQAIIDYRTKNGAFKTVDDLEKVPGIGPATMKEIRSDISVTGGAAPAKAAKAEAKGEAKGAAKKEVKEPAKVDGKNEKAAKKEVAADKKAEAKKDAKKDAKADDKMAKKDAKQEEPKGDKK